MKLETLSTEAEVAQAVARRVVALVGRRPDATLILPAGRTPLALYGELVQRARAGQVDLSQAALFQLDEYVGTPPDDQRSFNALLHRSLIDLLPEPPATLHLLDGGATDPTAEIERHAGELESRGGADLAILGLGLNGHVGYNEPGSRPEDVARRVTLHATSRAATEQSYPGHETPTEGITLGIREIAASREIVIIVTGSSKADILHALLSEPSGPARPASLLLGHPAITLYADAQAAARLPGTADSSCAG